QQNVVLLHNLYAPYLLDFDMINFYLPHKTVGTARLSAYIPQLMIICQCQILLTVEQLYR
ncbi:MAG: hypothetical protein R6V77_05990, partial [Candidatus Cloacimonadaceae bacterium]